MHPYIEETLALVRRRDGEQPEFLQAVHEVFESLEPILKEHPEIIEHNILQRLSMPDKLHIFRIVWEDDHGKIQVNKGYRIGYSNALGPCKGGLRFHPTVNSSILKFLAFEQTFKNSLTGLYMGGGKGGADFDPKGKSESEVMRFCQAFMTQLYHYIGPTKDVPAGDIGVGAREIAYLFGQYKRITGRYDMGILTGKDVGWGGSLVRKEATGFGAVYFGAEVLRDHGSGYEGKTVLVSGSGNVAMYAIKKLQELGAKVVACSDSNGYIYDKNGLDFEVVRQLKEVERKRISDYCEIRKSATFISQDKGSIWDVPCDAAFPCATQNELDEPHAKALIKNGCKLVCEGANMPSTPKAIAAFQQAGVYFCPGKAANAGGVAVSNLEMQQNASWASWKFEDVDQKLKEIMASIHEKCVNYSQRYTGKKDDYVSGANIGGFLKVAQIMIAHGVM